MKIKDIITETIEASQDMNALLKGIEADLKQRAKDLKKLPKKSIYSEDVVDGNFPRQQRDQRNATRLDGITGNTVIKYLNV